MNFILITILISVFGLVVIGCAKAAAESDRKQDAIINEHLDGRVM